MKETNENTHEIKQLKSFNEFLNEIEEGLPGNNFSECPEVLRCLLSQLFVIKKNKELSLEEIKSSLEHGKMLGLMGKFTYQDTQHRAIKREIENLIQMGFAIKKVKNGVYIYESKDFFNSIVYIDPKITDRQNTFLLPNVEKHTEKIKNTIQKAIKGKNVIVFDYLDENCSATELSDELVSPSGKLPLKKSIHVSPYAFEHGILIGGRLEKNEQAFPLHRYFSDYMFNVRVLSYGKEKNVHFLSGEVAFEDYFKVFNQDIFSFYSVLKNNPWNFKKYVITFLGDEYDDLKEEFLLTETKKAKKLADDEKDERMETSFICDNELRVFRVIYRINKDYGADIRFKSKLEQKRYEAWLEKQKKD